MSKLPAIANELDGQADELRRRLEWLGNDGDITLNGETCLAAIAENMNNIAEAVRLAHSRATGPVSVRYRVTFADGEGEWVYPGDSEHVGHIQSVIGRECLDGANRLIKVVKIETFDHDVTEDFERYAM